MDMWKDHEKGISDNTSNTAHHASIVIAVVAAVVVAATYAQND